MKKSFVIPVLCFVFANSVEALTAPPQLSPGLVKASYQRTYVLPVNWAATPKYGLVVTIPQGFKPLQPADEMSASTELLEYVPEGQDGNNWTEIISVSKYIGKNIPAIKLIEGIKTQLLAKVTNGKIWIETNSTKPNYQQATVGIVYDYQGKREVMGAQYISGPYDCVGVQYTIRPKLGLTDEDATKTIESFFKTNLQVVAFTPD